MEQIKPTVFKNVNAAEAPNAEQLLCGKALDTVIALGIFDSHVFMDLDLYPTNHLLKWCIEVLTAHEFKFFERDEDIRRDQLIDDLKTTLVVDLMLANNRTYEMEYNLKAKYDGFFRKNLSLYSFDDALGLLLDERNSIFVKMDEFRQSLSLEKFIGELVQINPVSVQDQDTKLSADETQVVLTDVPISALQAELVSTETFTTTLTPRKRPSPKKKESEVTGPLPKRKVDSPKKESAIEKRKKHQAMTHNARRRIGGMNLTHGYTKMPKDRAEYDFRRGVYIPTIKLKDLEELKAFDFEFPPEKREHGFMISFQDQTLYWNKDKQDFQPEIIKIKI